MNRTKGKYLLAVLLILCFFMPTAALASAPANNNKIIIYAKLPADWSDPHLWAWADDGTNVFAAWPGGEMEADSGNIGWYYCWIPETANHIIINANDAAVQTTDQKIEKKNTWLTVTAADKVTIDYEAKTMGALPEYVETFKVHARLPEDWQDAACWAWSVPNGKNAFAERPGKAMKKENNGWYTVSVPVWVNRMIISGNGENKQTEELSIDAAEIWVMVDQTGKTDFTYNDPNALVAEDITVQVKVPDNWNEPHLWAWSAPDGTNAFVAWPGEALQKGSDGWLTLKVPGWVNSIIVNGNGGSVQTSDLAVEAGKDIWIVVTDAETLGLSYEKPADNPKVEEKPTAKETKAEEKSTAKAVETALVAESPAKENGRTKLIIFAVVAAVLIGGGIIFLKKKR